MLLLYPEIDLHIIGDVQIGVLSSKLSMSQCSCYHSKMRIFNILMYLTQIDIGSTGGSHSETNIGLWNN